MGFSIAEILQAQGDAAAKARQARGTMWGSLAQYAGTIPREIIADRAQERERAQVAQVRQLQIQKGQAEAQQQQDEQGKLEVLRQVYRVAQDPTTGKLDEQRAAAIIAQSRFPELTEFMAKAKQAGLDKELEASVKRSTIAENAAHAKLYEAQAGAALNPPKKPPTADEAKFGAFLANQGLPPESTYSDLTNEQRTAFAKFNEKPPSPPTYLAPTTVMVKGVRTVVRPRSDGVLISVRTGEPVNEVDPDVSEADRARRDKAAENAIPADIGADVQTTFSGHRYVDLGGYTPSERTKVREAATAQGIPTVSKEDSETLKVIDNARLNQRDLLAEVQTMLPKDATGRVVGAPGRKLSTLFQTDAQRAAFGAWRSAAIQTLKATAGAKGLRINQAEIAQAITNDIPTIDDTLETATQKVSNINKMLDNAELPIVVRDRSTQRAAAPSAAPAPAAGRVRVVGPNGETGTVPAGTPLLPGWKESR